jgi:hypothetical protein
MFTLDNAIVYDEECFPNAWILCCESLNSDAKHTFEISEWRNDITDLIAWLDYLAGTNTPMIGFNNVGYDYPMLHYIRSNPHVTPEMIYEKNQSIIGSDDRFGNIIWDRDRFVPQIDLMRVHHFDNVAKTTSLKALEINMRSDLVLESSIPFGTVLTRQQLDEVIIPYCQYDTGQTKQFAHYSKAALAFRVGLIDRFGIEVLNWNDVKIGVKMLEQRIGEDICYDKSSGRRRPRQTPRRQIKLSEIIFPYVRFEHSEFQRIHQFMLEQTLKPEDIDDPDAPIKTKGVFTNLTADVGGLKFYFGTGGVHASVEKQRFASDENYAIVDIDVEGLYPNVAIVNQLAPEHLGEAFIGEYAKIPQERKTHAKGTYDNAALKLAANGPWGQSNNKYSVFYDPKYAMTIPINGQLMICMLAEQLVKVPTLRLIQANTDGITYIIRRDMIDQAKQIEDWWQSYTLLKLEYAEYTGMWIRDVNNYIAQDVKGKLKLKGAYWHPDPLDYANSISTASPPCWYKDLGNIVSIRAAVAAMVYGIDPATFIKAHTDPFDFMCRVRANRGSRLIFGDEPIQGTTRYYVAKQGQTLKKVNQPPAGYQIGQWKKAPKVTDFEYAQVMRETGGQWDERVCTKNRSQYGETITNIEAGWLVQECNDVSKFSFDNVNYDWYLAETLKLII